MQSGPGIGTNKPKGLFNEIDDQFVLPSKKNDIFNILDSEDDDRDKEEILKNKDEMNLSDDS